MDLDVLMGLVNERLWTPDFLNPRPSSPLTNVDDELTALAEISPAYFTRQLESIHPCVPAALSGPPRAAIGRMVAAFRDYWEAYFSSNWPRMRTILESDITYRGRVTAGNGLHEMLNKITPSMSFEETRLSLRQARIHTELTIEVDGRGVMLVPTMFSQRAVAPVDLHGAPLIVYPARGQGTMWESEISITPDAVARILGKTRATLLTVLSEPASSTELGHRFGISTSAVNQHLRALLAAGLVTSTRYGHRMLYFRSPMGSILLEGPGPAS
ncbi:DNA-binding transcriptional ArsR family regulator [Paenarthrobacter ilicis]|uniref:DNA-binding transcriptional ArsR family regulator n=1 Tax=Paenarthrobacter ilicis TaxID=43665 RepID=A0ABX0TLG8_9MICC|nr:DUF5937 family protein [Paenarthrobacter ilicis]NIJ03428.1 DNA-binding transcriptional ArsR family regulator [Paenarthrobacter ilicis]